MLSKLKKLIKPVTNAATDPGAVFQTSNAILSSGNGASGIVINALSGLIASAVRGITELRKTGIDVPVPQFAEEKMVKNPGNGLIIAGAANWLSGVLVLLASSPDNTRDASILFSFGTANLAWGAGRAMKPGSTAQKLTDAFGTVTAATGLFLSAPDTHLAIKSAYGLAVLSDFYTIATGKVIHRFLHPNLIFAFTAAVNVTTNTGKYMIANIFNTLGHLSVYSLKTSGGVMEGLRDLFRKKSGSAETAAPVGPLDFDL